MSYAANVIAGYSVTAAAVVAYAVWVLRRGRVLGRSLGIGPEEQPSREQPSREQPSRTGHSPAAPSDAEAVPAASQTDAAPR